MNILITGASRGLGLEICKKLLADGHTVYAVARKESEEIAELKESFADTLFFKCADLSNPRLALEMIFAPDFINNSVRLEGVVNNAAKAYDDLISNLNIDTLEETFAVNVFAPMMIVKKAIRNMIFNNTHGSIVHISSICAHTGYKGLAMYAATKGAIEAFSKNTAREWGTRGIRSNTVVPGFMETEMSSSLSAEQKNKIYNRTSLKRAADISSVADTTVFLLGEKSSSITAQDICVDCGTI